MNGRHRRKDSLRCDALSILALKLVGKDIKQRFGIRARVEMSPILLDKHCLELVRVGEVTVVGQANAVGRIDVEGLGLGRFQGACRRVAAMADADIAPQFVHVLLLEDVTDESVLLAGAEGPIEVGHHAGSILPPVLKDGQRIIDGLIDRPMADDANDATHVRAGFLVDGPTALVPRPAA
jgi:hypothetical protein